mmetsp:Transcript_51317/g.155417  ORF Transcript_51317/g.155417 Transcript_51317/m.155417 type:complete len:697 (+) Transcript_51317:78-2168(+)
MRRVAFGACPVLCAAWGLEDATVLIQETVRQKPKSIAESIGPFLFDSNSAAFHLPDNFPSAAWGDDKLKGVRVAGYVGPNVQVAGFSTGGSPQEGASHTMFGGGYHAESAPNRIPADYGFLGHVDVAPNKLDLVNALPSPEGGFDVGRLEVDVNSGHLSNEQIDDIVDGFKAGKGKYDWFHQVKPGGQANMKSKSVNSKREDVQKFGKVLHGLEKATSTANAKGGRRVIQNFQALNDVLTGAVDTSTKARSSAPKSAPMSRLVNNEQPAWLKKLSDTIASAQAALRTPAALLQVEHGSERGLAAVERTKLLAQSWVSMANYLTSVHGVVHSVQQVANARQAAERVHTVKNFFHAIKQMQPGEDDVEENAPQNMTAQNKTQEWENYAKFFDWVNKYLYNTTKEEQEAQRRQEEWTKRARDEDVQDVGVSVQKLIEYESQYHFPEITIPLLAIPEINLPEVHIPAFHVPKVHIPEIALNEDVVLPEINIEEMDFPEIHWNKFFFPGMFLTPQHFRALHIPKEDFGKITVPQLVTNDGLDMATVDTPPLKVPHMEFPYLKHEFSQWGSMSFPRIHIPAMHIPEEFHFPKEVHLPQPVVIMPTDVWIEDFPRDDVRLWAPEHPRAAISLPGLHLPALVLPKDFNTTGSFVVPGGLDIPEIDLPAFNFTGCYVPSFELFAWHIDEFYVPPMHFSASKHMQI